MKKIFAFFCVCLWTLFPFVAGSAQQFTTVRDGIEYAELVREIDKLPVRMNLLRLDLKKVRLDVVHAMDAAIGLEKTSSIAARHGAIAAINAGFFRIDRSIYEGDNVSVLMIDGKLLSENSNNRISLLIKNDESATRVGIGRANLNFKISSAKIARAVSGVNRERKSGELILYTPQFHRTTLTDSGGIEIAVSRGRVASVTDGKGSNLIPADGFVLSATGKFRDELKSFKVGDKLSAEISSDAADFKISETEDIISGVPQLIKNGVISITWQEEKSSQSFVDTRHPRTAVAKLKDGKFLMMTVDGRSEQSAGIGLPQLAEILLELGATDAMNLDGGGSTTMFLDGKIVNHPSDKEGERKVGDAILVSLRK